MRREVWTALKTIGIAMAIAFVVGVAMAPHFESNRLQRLSNEIDQKKGELRQLQKRVASAESDLEVIRSDIGVVQSELAKWQARVGQSISVRAGDFETAIGAAGLKLGDVCVNYCEENVELICDDYASDYATDYMSDNCTMTQSEYDYRDDRCSGYNCQ